MLKFSNMKLEKYRITIIASFRALVLGLTLKEDCLDTRNSKVIDIIEALRQFNIQFNV